MPIKAVVFDLDGTIIDSEPINSKAYELVLKEYGKKPIPNPNGLVHIPGIKAKENWPYLQNKHHIEEDTHVLTKKKQDYFWNLLKSIKLKPKPGFLRLLKKLHQEKIITAIVTGSPFRNAEIVTKRFGIYNLFSAFATGDDITHGKPNPEFIM